MQDEKRKVTDKIVKWLREEGASVWKYHGSAYGVKGHSDVYGVLPKTGRAFFIECKDPTNPKPVPPPQLLFLEEVAENNAIAFVARSLLDAQNVMEEFL